MNVLLTGKKFERGESAYYIYMCMGECIALRFTICLQGEGGSQADSRCNSKGGYNCGCLLDYGMHDIYPQLTKCCIMVKCM